MLCEFLIFVGFIIVFIRHRNELFTMSDISKDAFMDIPVCFDLVKSNNDLIGNKCFT